jgi:hypothetical protein
MPRIPAGYAVVSGGKLTRGLLLRLSTDHWLATASSPGTGEKVVPLARRPAQWERIRKAGWAGRLCRVYGPVTPETEGPRTYQVTLSRSLLLGLREGVEVYTTSVPFRKERMVSPAGRMAQWRRFREAGLTGKTGVVHGPA